MYRKHEAQLQVDIATSAGFDEHGDVWQTKADALDVRIGESTAVLQGLVDGLRIMTFQRFAAAIVIGTVGCTTPGVTGGLRRCCDRTSQTPGSLRAQCNF